VTLAKAIGGGLPIGAVGGTEDAMRVLVDGTMEQEGTFNGNPLSMAAARAVLTEVLTPAAYVHLAELEPLMAGGLRDLIARYELPATVASIGCRGSVHFRAEPVRDFRDHAQVDADLAHLAWLFQLNGGVFQPAGDPWTFSVMHTEEDLGRALGAFEAFAAAVTA